MDIWVTTYFLDQRGETFNIVYAYIDQFSS